jgi:hypothetical protein
MFADEKMSDLTSVDKNREKAARMGLTAKGATI